MHSRCRLHHTTLPLPLFVCLLPSSCTRPLLMIDCMICRDACAAMQGYESAGDRRFNIDYEQFEGLTFETAGAFLAGLDTVEAAAAQTTELVDHTIDELLGSVQLTNRFANGPAYRELMLAYRKGLRESSTTATQP